MHQRPSVLHSRQSAHLCTHEQHTTAHLEGLTQADEKLRQRLRLRLRKRLRKKVRLRLRLMLIQWLAHYR